MVYVPSAKAFGYDLKLNEAAMQDILLNDSGLAAVLDQAAQKVLGDAAGHIAASGASGPSVENYQAASFSEAKTTDDLGIEMSGDYNLGNRQARAVGVRNEIPDKSRPNKKGKPALVTESERHGLIASLGDSAHNVSKFGGK